MYSIILLITTGLVTTASAPFIAMVLNACIDIMPNFDAPDFVAVHTALGLFVFKN